MLLHRVGERRAAFDVRAGRENRLGEVLVFFLVAENLEALHERQARVDHDGELADEHRQVLRIDLLAELALLRRGCARRFLLRRRDARDEHLLAPQRRDGGVGVVGDALAADVFSAARAARIGKCRHVFLSSLKEQTLSLCLPCSYRFTPPSAAAAACPGARRDLRPARRPRRARSSARARLSGTTRPSPLRA